MGWGGYGLYDGDGTQTRHYSFMEWAKIFTKKELDDIDFDCLKFRKTSIPKEKRHLLIDNQALILKRMPKLTFLKPGAYPQYGEDDAIDWQMLLALFVDNKIKAPKIIIDNGLAATEYLMEFHASEFDEPGKRRAALRRFKARALKNNNKK